MTHPHEHEDRELVSHMERALATAVSTTAALVEAFMRRQQRTAQRIAQEAARTPGTAAEDAATASRNYAVAADSAARTRGQARHALGVGQSDKSFWDTASEQAIADRIRKDYGADPSMIGDREHDRRWATSAEPREVVDVYNAAAQWADSSPVAEQLAENLHDLLGDYGIDTMDDEWVAMSPEAAAEELGTARAQHWQTFGKDYRGDGSTGVRKEATDLLNAHDREWIKTVDPDTILDTYAKARQEAGSSFAADVLATQISDYLAEFGVDVDLVAGLPRDEAAELVATNRAGQLTATGPDDERTVDDITRLIDDRDSALDTADRDGDRAQATFDRGDEMSRTADVLSAAVAHPGSDAAHAAALAVDGHPTQPRAATQTSAKAATKARPAGRARTSGVDRGHDGR